LYSNSKKKHCFYGKKSKALKLYLLGVRQELSIHKDDHSILTILALHLLHRAKVTNCRHATSSNSQSKTLARIETLFQAIVYILPTSSKKQIKQNVCWMYQVNIKFEPKYN